MTLNTLHFYRKLKEFEYHSKSAIEKLTEEMNTALKQKDAEIAIVSIGL
jgi:hypothetical protein